MACRHDLVVARLEEELAFLNMAIAACDWRFSQLSVLEARHDVINSVLDMLREETL